MLSRRWLRLAPSRLWLSPAPRRRRHRRWSRPASLFLLQQYSTSASSPLSHFSHSDLPTVQISYIDPTGASQSSAPPWPVDPLVPNQSLSPRPQLSPPTHRLHLGSTFPWLHHGLLSLRLCWAPLSLWVIVALAPPLNSESAAAPRHPSGFAGLLLNSGSTFVLTPTISALVCHAMSRSCLDLLSCLGSSHGFHCL